MNDVYEATLHMTKDGVAYVSTLDSYSIADYAYSQLNKPNFPEKLKKVCANMLQYGAAAQIWKNYRTDALATERMTEEHKAYLVDPSTVVFGDNSAKLNDIDNPTIKLIGKSLSLESKVIIRFIIDATNWKDRLHELSLHVTYKTLEGTTETVVIDTCEEYLLERNFYSFSFDSLRSAELRSVVSAAVYHGDTQISTTMQYSVDSYGNGKTGTMLALCQAMIAYSDTALAFFS